MVQRRLSGKQLQQITWPQDVIYDKNVFAGYVMPKLKKASSLTELYSAEKYDLRFRLMAAINLCAAIDTVHEMGQVCGDLNPQNICVNLDKNDRQNGFKVTLVDTDSYHFSANGNTYRCEVGLGDFIAPELQNKMTDGLDLKSVPLPSYTRQTDLFALAVHIFYLLMNGCHPFACAKDINPEVSNIVQMTAGVRGNSIVTPQPVENIKNGFFPFYEEREGIMIPMYAPAFDSLPHQIRVLFIRSFVDGYGEPSKRVTALEWQQALSSLLGNIKECTTVGNHYYFDHVVECPLCKVDRKMEGILGKQMEIPLIQNDSVQSSSISGRTNVNQQYHYWNTGANNYIGKNAKRGKGKSGVGRWLVFSVIAIMIKWLVLAGIAIMIIGPAIGINGQISDIMKKDTNLSVEDTLQSQYRQLIINASTAAAEEDYDSAISYCDEAISLKSDDNISKKQAYYWKGIALYAKKDLENAYEVLQAGQGEAYDEEIGAEYDELIEEIQKAIQEKKEKKEAAAKKAKADAKKLKKLNKIISAIKNKQYKRADKLMLEFWVACDSDKIYVKGNKIVKTITEGKGFVFVDDVDDYYAYYGEFIKGKISGQGILVNDSECIDGEFKNGYPNGKCTVKKYYSALTFIGSYKNGWENGDFTMIDNGNDHKDTYHFTSKMGRRQVIRKDKKGRFIYAVANSGWYCYATKKSNLSGYNVYPHKKKK